MKNLIVTLILILSITGCSSVESDSQLFKKAKELTSENKFQEAVTAYEQLLKKYPESNFADSTLLNLASIYQNKKISNLTGKQSLEKAISYFKRIYDDYPKSDLAPTGLFMCGFIQANELKDFEAATKTYNLFIEKFPDSELASSAKEELKNMGLSPEDILMKNLSEENARKN